MQRVKGLVLRELGVGGAARRVETMFEMTVQLLQTVKHRSFYPKTRPAGTRRHLRPCATSSRAPRTRITNVAEIPATTAASFAKRRGGLQPHIDVAIVSEGAPQVANELPGSVGALMPQRHRLQSGEHAAHVPLEHGHAQRQLLVEDLSLARQALLPHALVDFELPPATNSKKLAP